MTNRQLVANLTVESTLRRTATSGSERERAVWTSVRPLFAPKFLSVFNFYFLPYIFIFISFSSSLSPISENIGKGNIYRGILELRFLSHEFNTLKMKKRLRPFSYRAGPHAISVSPLDMLSLPVSSSMNWEM